ncbi:MAG: putative acetyltransferase [Firmicutes bacterium ADurb.Bin419]|nr:MAG: putative acetyltransferase [Firmicutes bacterium ADurb.Bin419]
MNIFIERACEKDAPEIINIRNDCFYDDYICFGECPGYNISIDDMKNRIQNALSYKIVADDKIVGDISVHKLDNGVYWIGCLAISPNYQNKGIGTIVMKQIEKQHSEARVWQLETPLNNIRNCYFYERLGFVKIDEKVHSDILTLCVYEKRI